MTTRRLLAATLGFPIFVFVLLLVALHFGVAPGGRPVSAILSFALLLAPYWAFSFGVELHLRRLLATRASRLLAPLLLIASWLVFVLPRHEFRWSMCAALIGFVLLVCAILEPVRGRPGMTANDWIALLAIGLAVELPFFRAAWPDPGFGALSKLFVVNAALYGYLISRNLDGIGFVSQIALPDVRAGLRQFLYFLPVALAFGFVSHFLHFHPTWSDPVSIAAAWIFTFVFVAVPEELFFRGILLNLMERRWGARPALIFSSLLFGLAHFNKRAQYFNWRYVLLAAVAGYFYGRAWLERRRIPASGITHATVDTLWSIWLR